MDTKAHTVKSCSALVMSAAFLLASSCADMPDPCIQVVPRVGFIKASGDVSVYSGSRLFSAHSTADKLNLRREASFMPRIDLDWERLHISVTAASIKYSAHGRMLGSIHLRPRPYTTYLPVYSDLQSQYIAAETLYDILPITFMKMGFGFGIGAVTYDVSLNDKTVGLRLSADDLLMFGYFSARFAKDFGRLQLLAHLSGLAVDPDNWELHFRDIDLSASYRIFGSPDRIEGRLLAGYRHITLEYAFRDADIDISFDTVLQGPVLGFMLSF